MRTLFFSRTELGIINNFWEAFCQLQDNRLTDAQRREVQEELNEALAKLSPESSETFLAALEDFEENGSEFEVRIAPDDLKLVSQ